MKKGFILITFICSILSLNVHAIEFEDALYPELVTSSRALAMGNAFIAKSNDASSVFYNPAGLGSVRGWKFHLSNFHMEFSKSWLEASTGGKLIEAVGNFTQGFDLNGLRTLLNDTVDTPATTRFSVMPNFTTKYFSAGFLWSLLTRVQVNSSDEFEYADRVDYGPYAAMNLSLFGGIFKIGAMGILHYRSEAIGSAPKANAIALTDNDYNTGMFINVTGGAKLTIPIQWLPTFAAKMHNVLGSEFGAASGAGAPDAIKQQIDLAFSVTPKIGKIVSLHIEADWKDFTQEWATVSNQRKLMMGMELDIARTLFLRIGFSDGFGSLGFGINTQNLQVDMTTYARDLTDGSFQGREDRRFALTLSAGL